MFVRTVEIPVYYIDLILVIHEDFNVVDKKFKLKLKETYAPDDPDECDAITHQHPENKNEIYMLMTPDLLEIDSFNHELVHVMSYICSARGITLDYDNDEPIAYLQGYISKKLTEAVVAYMDAHKLDLRNFLLPDKK